MRPVIAQPTMLVYRECPCGEWVCTGEGALAPLCSLCGEPYMPGGGVLHEEPMFGTSHVESRRIRALGFVGILTSETGAVKLVSRIRSLLGLVGDSNEYVYASDLTAGRMERYFSPDEVSRDAAQ